MFSRIFFIDTNKNLLFFVDLDIHDNSDNDNEYVSKISEFMTILFSDLKAVELNYIKKINRRFIGPIRTFNSVFNSLMVDMLNLSLNSINSELTKKISIIRFEKLKIVLKNNIKYDEMLKEVYTLEYLS